MPPSSSKKATPAPKSASSHSQRDHRSSSRHSTPFSALTESSSAPPTPLPATPPTTAPATAKEVNMPAQTAYLNTPTDALVSTEPSIETLISGTSSKGHDPPSAKELHALHDKIQDTVNRFMGRRGEVCDRSMRQLVQRRKERVQVEREQAAAREETARVKREAEREIEEEEERAKTKKARKLSRKRSRDEMEMDVDGDDVEEGEVLSEGSVEKDLPTVGAHALAPQNGEGVHQSAPPPPSPKVQPGTAAIDPIDTAATAGSPAASEDGDHPSAPSTIPLYERAFGKDPAVFDDPTIYDIRPLDDAMTDGEKRAIFDVKHWPESDLHDLTAGDPPDMDFSNAKPANQVNFSTFQTYIEPYIRPFTEEDVAFLKERGDRFTPYVIPQRGAKGYKAVWEAEDGLTLTGIEPPAKRESDPNEARGSMEDMDDATAETDEVSMGPVMNRLMSIIRPTPSNNTSTKREDPDADKDGDTVMQNNDSIDASEQTQPGASQLPSDDLTTTTKPTTCLPADAPRPPTLPTLDYETLEARALQELRYIGFLAPTDTPSFAAHSDDEVSARLRTLQHELRRVSHSNNIRKARVLELAEERMAMQEYSNIADDLDNQVNAAYLKRNRSLGGKGAAGTKKQQQLAARAGKGVAAVGGAGLGGRGVSEGVRALMQKRRDWIEMVGPVVMFGRPGVPGDGETVFDEREMKRFEKAEREAELADVGDGE